MNSATAARADGSDCGDVEALPLAEIGAPGFVSFEWTGPAHYATPSTKKSPGGEARALGRWSVVCYVEFIPRNARV